MSLTKKEMLEKTEALKQLELPLPKEVKAFYKKCVEPSIGRGYEFADVITERNGLLFQRIFCFQVYGLGGRKPTVSEVGRRLEGGPLVVSNLYRNYGTMSPYLADDISQSETKHDSGWDPKYTDIVKNSNKISLGSPYICLNESIWVKKYPYCAWENYSGRECLFKYLSRYRKDQRVELLVKSGYSNFIGCNLLNKNGKNFEEIFKVKQPFAREYLKHGTPYDLILLRKYEWIDSEKSLTQFKTIKNDYVGKNLTDEEIHYILSKNTSVYIYSDYLRIAKLLAYPLNEKRYKYPDDIQKAHDDALKALSVIRGREFDEKIKLLSDEYQDLTFEKDGFVIFPVENAEQLVYESEKLEHCVRTYIEKVANRNSLIWFVRKAEAKETPLVTVETVKPSEHSRKLNKITQVYAFKDTRPDDSVIKFVQEWKKRFKLKSSWDPETAVYRTI